MPNVPMTFDEYRTRILRRIRTFVTKEITELRPRRGYHRCSQNNRSRSTRLVDPAISTDNKISDGICVDKDEEPDYHLPYGNP